MNKTIKQQYHPEGFTVVTLSNPPLNVITLEMTAYLTDIFDQLEKDHRTKAVVITGAGERAFCAGADIHEFNSVRDDVVNKKLKKENAAFQKIEDLSKPVIAAIGAISLGGGSELALACDIRVMSENARIGFPEIKLGVFPGSGGIYRLPQIIGISKAMELMYTGEAIDAKESLRIGLVNHVVPQRQVMEFSLQLATKIARGPKLALSFIKKGVRESMKMSLKESVELNLKLSDRVFKSEDCEEGVRAFFEKRNPEFKSEK